MNNNVTNKDISIAWSVWLDETNKVISIKETPNATAIYFKDRSVGIQKVNELVSKGYRIG